MKKNCLFFRAAALLQELMSASAPSQSADTITIDDDDGAQSTVKETQLGKRKQRKTDESIVELSDDENDVKKMRSDAADATEVHETVRKDMHRLDQLVESGDNFLAKAPQIQVHHIETEERCTHEVIEFIEQSSHEISCFRCAFHQAASSNHWKYVTRSRRRRILFNWIHSRRNQSTASTTISPCLCPHTRVLARPSSHSEFSNACELF